MPDSHVRTSAQADAPACPFLLVDILRLLGALRRFPEPGFEEVEEMIWWLSSRIHELTGILHVDILQAVCRLGEGKVFDGTMPGGYAEAYGGFRSDLTHVSAPLHEL